jgi:hypothetical protein
MAKKRISRKQKKGNKKVGIYSPHATLCALAPVIDDKDIFEPIHQKVKIPQKTLIYRPTDKLIFLTLGIISGSETVYDLNQEFRVDKPLLKAFGYKRCADQSVIQQTLNAATEENVAQLEEGLKEIWDKNNLTVRLLENAQKAGSIVTVDIDLSGQKASKKAEKSTKGYFSKDKNAYGRQLARVLVSQTQEIVVESLYPGNTLSLSVFKEMVKKMEGRLGLTDKSQRSTLCLRLDAGFGTDENINYALWCGYHLLVKMYSGKRAKALSKSVNEWVDVPTGADNTPRQAGWVSSPHRYSQKTRQLCVRTPKKKGGYEYGVLVSTDLSSDLPTIVIDYDGRSGVPESNFCQDSQGLKNRKRRKRGFVAQQVLTLINQLAHNMIRWMQSWLIESVEESVPEALSGDDNVVPTEITEVSVGQDAQKESVTESVLVIKSLKERGMKRFVSQILSISGRVEMKGQRILKVILNPLYPIINRIKMAFRALLKPYGITVSLDKS